MSTQIVLERRLRPIYDALDACNTKKALQEADKVLKKHPNTTCAKILRALCLIRIEKLPEAMSIIDSIDVPGARHDENTLQAFIHCFKEATIPERICQLYERACEVDPSDLNLSQLFISYVRTKDYKKQQTVALRLYKEFNNSPYFYWAVMSIVMQAIENPTLGEKMLYPLADKMFQAKICKEGYSENAKAEIELNFLILEGMKRWEDCYNFLCNTDAAASKLAIFNNEKRAEYLLKLERFDELSKIAGDELDQQPDNWTMWNHKIRATIELAKHGDSSKIVDELAKFISEHVEKVKNKKTRGPYMAKLEAIKQIQQADGLKNVDLEKFGKAEDLIFDFVRKFHLNPSCYADIELYFCLLKTDVAKSALITKLTEWIGKISKEDEDPEDKKEKKVWAVIVFERVRRAFGEWKKMEKVQQRQLLQQFIAQIVHPGRSELAQGVLCQLAISSLWDSWRKDDNLDHFYEMVLLLEHVAGTNKSDPICKLSLIRAYSHIGNTARVTALVKILDIKAVQCDTLGYLTFPIFELAGRFNLAIIANTQLSLIYDQAEKEIMECSVLAYKNGKFEQIPGFSLLSNRMKKSGQALACDVLNRYLSSLFVIEDLDEAITTCYGDEESINWSDILDNRDLSVIPATEDENYAKLLEDMKTRTFKEFVDITKLRHSLCRSLGTIGRITREGVPQELSRKELNNEIDQLQKHVDYCSKEYQTFDISSRLAQSPAPMCISQWVHSSGLKTVVRFIEAARTIVRALDEGKNVDDEVLGTSIEFGNELRQIVDVYTGDKKPKKSFWIREPILAASRALQTMAILQILIRLIDRIVSRDASNVEQSVATTTTLAPKKKGSKKEVEVVVTSKFSEYCNSFLNEIQVAAKRLSANLDMLRTEAGSEDLIPTKVGEDLGQIFLCSFNETRSNSGHFLSHDVIIFDFGLFHELIHVQECIANYLDGGYMRCLWCLTQMMALILTIWTTLCVPKPHPLLLWPTLIIQNAYCFGLVILTIATADKLLVALFNPVNAHLNLMILYFAVGTCFNHFFDYILWHYYWYEEFLYIGRTGKHVIPFWV